MTAAAPGVTAGAESEPTPARLDAERNSVTATRALRGCALVRAGGRNGRKAQES
jgi:hypothetical protein